MTDLVERLRDKTQWMNDLGLQDEAADEIERLRAENFALAANQCKAGYSGEHGDHMCRYLDTLHEIKRCNAQYHFGSKLVRLVDGALEQKP